MNAKLTSIALSGFLLFSTSLACAEQMAPISGFARSFILGSIIPNAKITILETGDVLHTDDNGHFGPFNYPVGKPITLQLEKWEYKTTQTGTMIVPPEGLTGPYNNITFQVPSIESFYVLATIVGAKQDENSCHVATTVTGYHKTLDDLPQGEEGAEVSISPYVAATPFYFDIFKEGPLKDRTNPFTKGLTQTSADGGVAFFNLPPSDVPYTMTATKDGMTFSTAQFWCRKGAFINISPPQGPMELPNATH